jgi:glycosyltransferase involved in cell wall biosynthesis
MKDLISVIVPVYNVAAYLPECVESILHQDHTQLEVILIDDGSTDDSGVICDRYAAEDHRVRVVHQKNGGAAAAKNAGLRIATGEYLAFADSDDYLEPGAYSHMLELVRQSQADAAECSFRYISKTVSEDQILYPDRRILSGKDYLLQFTKGWNCALLWNKLYKRSLFDGIFFEEGHRIDDEYFTYQGMMNAASVICDSKVVYNYRRRRSGAMLNPLAGEQRMLDRVDYMDKRRRNVSRRFPELKRAFDTEFLDAMVYFTEYPENTLISLEQIKKKLKGYLMERGNTIPPRFLWRGIGRIVLTPSRKLLERCPQQQDQNQRDYFA